MQMRALVIDEETEQRAKELLAFARDPENWYRPPFTRETAPGMDERYLMEIPVGFRVVFSYTKPNDPCLYKHLSVSIDEPKLYPSPEAIVIIAALFEFSGAKEANCSFHDWNMISQNAPIMMRLDEKEHCIVIIEEIAHAQHSH